jgi:putative transposase
MRRATRKRAPAQGELRFTGWGGRRECAGRKPGTGRRKLLHRARQRLPRRKFGSVLHVTIRLVDAVAHVRRWRVFAAFVEIVARAQRDGFRVNEFSLQDGHLHLIVESSDWRALSNGMRGLEIRLARRLNALHGRRGRTIEDRYHSRVLASPREVRNCLVYVLQNAMKHARTLGGLAVDPLSSAAWFGGWRDPEPARKAREMIAQVASSLGIQINPAPTAPPKTWLLREGWRRRGLVAPTECPA